MALPLALLIPAAAGLTQGLLQQKAQAEEERKKRAFEGLKFGAESNLAAQQQLARSQEDALSNALGAARSGFLGV